MRIIGCDLHARQQMLAMLDTTTGEVVNTTLKHEGLPGEYSSGKRQRLGGPTKRGNPLLRFLWSEATAGLFRDNELPEKRLLGPRCPVI
jgi:hypothetical protein